MTTDMFRLSLSLSRPFHIDDRI